ncbi:MAG TPA: dihydropteroate synthase [Xanthobacteraceae bacterium]|nr:dihydropteroate synthase [Xanthobacteraceae bacterium]
MGILNVTPDSFSDGGQFLGLDAALAQAKRLIAEGADILDVGGESTRPYGSVPVSADEEWARIGPVLDAITELSVPVSIDTMKAVVAEKALAAGATIVNDVWGLQRDGAMAPTVAAYGAGIVIMHNRTAADAAIDILADIDAFFARSLELADSAGIHRDRIVLDPGIGFGKTPEQSIAVIARLDRLKGFGLPLLIGLSRKRFIASVSPSEPHQRLGGSIAANLAAVRTGAAIVRVHDVAETVQALRIAAAIEEAR